MNQHHVTSGIGIAFGFITKYAAIALFPLVLVMRKWTVMLHAVVFLLVISAVTIIISKPGPFKVYSKTIVPTLGRSHDLPSNQSIVGFACRLKFGDIGHPVDLPKSIRMNILALQAAMLFLMLWLLLKRPFIYWDRPEHVLAAAAVLISFLLIFSPVFWDHYAAYLCVIWPWLIYEGLHNKIRAAAGFIAMALSYYPATSWHDMPEPYNSHILLATIIIFALAMWKLMVPPDLIAPSVLQQARKNDESETHPEASPSNLNRDTPAM